MPPPRPRLTIRRLMLAVAVCGVAFGVWEGCRRYQATITARPGLRARAEWCRALARLNDDEAADGDRLAGKGPSSAAWKVRAAIMRRRAEHFRLLARKYDRAADRPWLPVAPDPREPE